MDISVGRRSASGRSRWLSQKPFVRECEYSDDFPSKFGVEASVAGEQCIDRGQGEQGFYVYDVWESREDFERFMEERLGPAMAEVMGGPPPEGGAAQFFPMDVLVTQG